MRLQQKHLEENNSFVPFFTFCTVLAAKVFTSFFVINIGSFVFSCHRHREREFSEGLCKQHGTQKKLKKGKSFDEVSTARLKEKLFDLCDVYCL